MHIHRLTAFILQVALLGSVVEAHAQSNFWMPTHGPFGGIVNSVAVNADGHLFVATGHAGANGTGTGRHGLFRSIDNGQTWTPINNGLTNTHVNALAINTTGDIFAGTYFGGIFRSTDHGESWTPVNSGLPARPSQVDALVVDAEGRVFAGLRSGQIFRSVDHGATWSEVQERVGLEHRVTALAVTPEGHIFAGTADHIIRSTDGGTTWEQVHRGYIEALTVNAEGDLFAGTFFHGILRSVDNGQNWVPANNRLTGTRVRAFATSQGMLFAGVEEAGIFRSEDNGESWTPVNNGLFRSDIRSLAVNASGHVFAGTDGGVFRSTDAGASWVASSEGLTSIVYALARDVDGHIFAGTSGGVFRLAENSTTWAYAGYGLSATASVLALAADAAGYLFAGTGGIIGEEGDGIFRSADHGESWMQVNNGLLNTDVNALTVNTDGYVFAGTGGGGIFRSLDKGDTWIPMNQGLPANANVYALTKDAAGNVFAGLLEGGVCRLSSAGTTWGCTSTGLPNTLVWAVATSTGEHLFAGTGHGVFQSRDGGLNWIQRTNGSAPAIASSGDGKIFVGVPTHLHASTPGVARYLNDGEAWTRVEDGLQDNITSTVLSFVTDAQGYIWAGTDGEGVYQSTHPVVVATETAAVPDRLILEQNHPNPFQSSTTISFSLSRPAYATLRVYDLLGREVATLASKVFSVGLHSVTFDARGLPSGVYFYRLEGGGAVQGRTFVLHR